MTGLKSLLQHPMKGDQRLKTLCDVKGEDIFLFDDLVPCHNVVYVQQQQQQHLALICAMTEHEEIILGLFHPLLLLLQYKYVT